MFHWHCSDEEIGRIKVITTELSLLHEDREKKESKITKQKELPTFMCVRGIECKQ